MAKATSIKDALKKWEQKNGENVTQAEDVQLQFQYPPIAKMDGNLGTLQNCKKLSLSSNQIDRIVGIATLKNLKILSLARNNIRSLSGIEALGETLEQLWISYNFIDKLNAIDAMKQLKVFYIGNNTIRDWNEFQKLSSLPALEDLLFCGNPLVENMDEAAYRKDVMKKLKGLKKLDGETIIRDED